MNNEDAIKKAIKRILCHPDGVVCKHWMIAVLLSALEEAGGTHTLPFVRAIVHADDDTALELLSEETILSTA